MGRKSFETFAKNFPKLLNEAAFSPAARRTLLAIANANQGDEGAVRFGVRAARALTVYDIGLHTNERPIYNALLYGPYDGPQLDLALALARSYIGKPINGMLPATVIDCSAFPPGLHPMALSRLVGPLMRENQQLPRLFNEAHQLPDIFSRAGPELLPLPIYEKALTGKFQSLIMQISEIAPSGPEIAEELIAAFNALSKKLEDLHEQIMIAHSPYRSVIIFDAIEFASPELLSDVIRPMLRFGYLSEDATFNNSLVLLTMYDPLKTFSRAGDVGFVYHENKDLYPRVRKALLKSLDYRGVTLDVGDQLIVTGPRHPISQQFRLERLIEDARKPFRPYKVRMEFLKDFKRFLIEKSRDPNYGQNFEELSEFPSNRLNEVIDRYVYLPLAQAMENGLVHKRCRIKFVRPASKDDPTTLKIDGVKIFGTSEKIQKHDIADALEANQIFKPKMRETPEFLKLKKHGEQLYAATKVALQSLQAQAFANKIAEDQAARHGTAESVPESEEPSES